MATEQTSHDLDSISMHIWHIDLDGALGDLVELLSDREIKRAEAKKQAFERNRFILAHGAMRSILGRYMGVSGGELTFSHGDKGKPSIRNPKSDIEFNLSHCDDMALLAVTYKIQVGIDLERIRTRPLQLKIAQRMFPDQIYKRLIQSPSDQFDVEFFRHWTELEARAKCVGHGIFSSSKVWDEITTKHISLHDRWMACVAVRDIEISSLRLRHFPYRN